MPRNEKESRKLLHATLETRNTLMKELENLQLVELFSNGRIETLFRTMQEQAKKWALHNELIASPEDAETFHKAPNGLMKELENMLQDIGVVGVSFQTRGRASEMIILSYFDTENGMDSLSDEIDLYNHIIKDNNLLFDTKRNAIESECKLLELHKIAMAKFYDCEGLETYGDDWEECKKLELEQIDKIKNTLQNYLEKGSN